MRKQGRLLTGIGRPVGRLVVDSTEELNQSRVLQQTTGLLSPIWLGKDQVAIDPGDITAGTGQEPQCNGK